ncbi:MULTISPECIES: hypothetical protein [Aeromonas]|uniref:hypothetical protein n=1 Tax=Aeromonas sp. WP2-W18-CRE-05 TaxID=2675707 RepID=UPI0015DC4028|nr:hypothetical protein [Aeromonas sp. WP2-W18-CRE-05]BBQ27664.1 hypothetical protein WP2W18C05_38800 [Aeromonas sp. WP2-W18-CRE-05]
MTEQQYGSRILAEVQDLYPIMKARKPKYGRRELPHLISQHVPSLVHTPLFRSELLELVQQRPDWGHTQFIEPLFELIGQYFGIAVPDVHKAVPKGPKPAVHADAVGDRMAQLEMQAEDLRLEMTALPEPWDDD